MSIESENCDEEDARRYRWLAREFAKGRETYLGEWIGSKDDLDAHCDNEGREDRDNPTQ